MWIDKESAQKRYNVCKTCEHFIHLTVQCKKCGCFMKLKCKLKDAKCPLNKWPIFLDNKDQ